MYLYLQYPGHEGSYREKAKYTVVNSRVVLVPILYTYTYCVHKYLFVILYLFEDDHICPLQNNTVP